MVEFLNTSKAYAAIEDIVSKAENNLVLISPYIKIPGPLLVRLKDAGEKRKVHVTVVCRKADLKADVKSDVEQVENLELRFLESLHAKCFYNERSMVITSLNLYEYSQQNNTEMGILLSAEKDGAVFDEARQEAEFIVRTSTPEVRPARPAHMNKRAAGVRPKKAEASPTISDVLTTDIGDALKKAFPTVTRILSSPDSSVQPRGKRRSAKTKQGYCLRCGKGIPYDLGKPYCRSCFVKWAEWENRDYEESHCHACGKSEPATMARPRCRSCYSRSEG